MSNVLVYFTWQLKPVHHGIMIGAIEELVNNDNVNKVFVLTCDGSLLPCYSNMEENKLKCIRCKFNRNVALARFGDKVIEYRINDSKKQYTHKWEYKTVKEIKSLEYNGVKIGYGALSSYISATRNQSPRIDKEFMEYFDKMLNYQVDIVRSLENIVEKHEIIQVWMFNGRTADSRPVYDYCRYNDIEVHCLEMIKKSEEAYFVNNFLNSLPHDIDYNNNRMNEVWGENVDAKAYEIGSSFFKDRRKGKVVRDRRSYVADQDKDLVPDGIRMGKKIIVIFNSSEDEFSAVGDIFESKSIFDSQIEGIRWILKHFEEESGFQFVVRLHPNLKGIQYSYHTSLLNLDEKYGNVIIVPAESSVSSYSLLSIANCVVSFGSSMGIEAVFWGKPSILLGGSFYYHVDSVHKPKTKSHLLEMLHNFEALPVGNKNDAIKYGYYLLNYEAYTNPNVNNPFVIKCLGLSLGYGHPHLRIGKSVLLFKLIDSLLIIINRLFYKNDKAIPKSENAG